MFLKSTNRALLLGLSIVILFTVDGRPRIRNQRQSTRGFQVIANSSFPCSDLTSTSPQPTPQGVPEDTSSPIEPLALTWDEIRQTMQYRHVSNDGTLTALTKEETKAFPNIIPLSDAFKRIVKEALNHDPNGTLHKYEIIQYLAMIEAEQETNEDSTSHVIARRDIGTSPSAPHTSSDVSTQEYCYNRGQPTKDDNYLYMCTVCSITTDLGQQYSPRYINEAECHIIDDQCLPVETNSFQGRCQTIELPLNILEKQEGYCALALKDGQTLVVEDWKVTTKMMKVGCHCTVDANSFFSYFV